MSLASVLRDVVSPAASPEPVAMLLLDIGSMPGVLPRNQREIRDIGVVAGVHRYQRGAMNERLGGDHAVEQLAARVSCACHDRAVGFGSRIVEREGGHCGKD